MSRRRLFTYDEALSTFPLVRDTTAQAVTQVEAIYSRVGSLDEANRRRRELESAVQDVIQAWAARILEIGCEVKGLWLVDWDCGDGYYCWRYPEESISFFHSYEEGFAGRVPIN